MVSENLKPENQGSLPEEALEGVAGGAPAEAAGLSSVPNCPKCGSSNVMYEDFPDKAWWHCYDCGYDWDFS